MGELGDFSIFHPSFLQMKFPSAAFGHSYWSAPFFHSFVRIALVSVALCLSGKRVFAGAAASQTHSIGFTVADADGQTVTSQDLSGMVSYDSATGTLTTPAAGAPLTGNWSWSNIDLVTGQTLAQQVLNWHSDAKNAEGAWLSVVQLKATGNVDPFMSYSFSAKNNTGANQSYSFSYGESIVPPVSGSYSIYTDLAGSLTHGTISPFAQIAPVLGDFDGDGQSEIQTLKLSTDGGLTFLNAGVDIGGAQSRAAAGTSIFGPISETIAGNLANVDYWQFDVGFTLTPGRDAAAFSGYAEISPIPEPATYAGIMGLAVLAGAALRRRISRAA